tara:strand:+ start:394 stop:1116 length:723 start_codon:yes stop_codon:yes gene_type:complete
VTFEEEYSGLLIKQFWDDPNARAEIEMQAETWKNIFEWLRDFPRQFDLDEAVGAQLDVLGRIVGISRIVPFLLPKIAFGFSDNPNARGFDDRFSPLSDRAPFADRFERQYTDLQLDDNDFRFFIRARISKNIASPYVMDAEGVSMRDAVSTLFSDLGYVLDNYDMSLTLYVSPQFDPLRLQAIVRLNLLPKPQGVRYKLIVQAGPGETFGFSDNADALPFADKFDLANQPGGRFAEKVII